MFDPLNSLHFIKTVNGVRAIGVADEYTLSSDVSGSLGVFWDVFMTWGKLTAKQA